MADGTFPTPISKDRDTNAVTNTLHVELSDGTVDLAKAADSAQAATDSGLGLLAVRNDVAGTLVDTDGDYTHLQTDDGGLLRVRVDNSITTSNASVFVDDSAFTVGTDSVTANGYLADETSPDVVQEGDIGIARMTLDRKILTRIVGSTDADRWEIDSSGHGQVDIAAVSVTAVPVSATAAANSETNPIYVQTVDTGLSASEIHDYDTASAVAADTTDNHDYTVANTTFLLKQVVFSSSGGGKAEIQTGPIAGLATVAVIFVPRHGGTERVIFDPPVEVPVTATGTVRVIRTNRQGGTQDLYSTIIGNDV